MEKEKRNFWDRIQYCDPRILYAILAVVLIIFEIQRINLPVNVPKAVQMLYDKIESLPDDKIVFMDCDIQSAQRAESLGQYISVVRHLFSRDIKFAVVNWVHNPEGQKYGIKLTGDIAKEMGKEYGKDYCVFQAWTQSGGVLLQAVAKDIPGMVPMDVNETPIEEIPMMKGVKDIYDVSLIYRVGYAWEWPLWIGFVSSAYGTPYACGAVGIASSTAYPLIDSGQICGMLPGAAGAAAYEALMVRDGITDKLGTGTDTLSVQSFATLYVILAIMLGNLAMFLAKYTKRRK